MGHIIEYSDSIKPGDLSKFAEQNKEAITGLGIGLGALAGAGAVAGGKALAKGVKRVGRYLKKKKKFTRGEMASAQRRAKETGYLKAQRESLKGEKKKKGLPDWAAPAALGGGVLAGMALGGGDKGPEVKITKV